MVGGHGLMYDCRHLYGYILVLDSRWDCMRCGVGQRGRRSKRPRSALQCSQHRFCLVLCLAVLSVSAGHWQRRRQAGGGPVPGLQRLDGLYHDDGRLPVGFDCGGCVAALCRKELHSLRPVFVDRMVDSLCGRRRTYGLDGWLRHADGAKTAIC